MDTITRCQSIQEMSERYPIVWLCKLAELSRAAYYKWKKTSDLREARQEKDANLKEHILAIHRLRPAYGYKRMRTALRKEGFPVNHCP